NVLREGRAAGGDHREMRIYPAHLAIVRVPVEQQIQTVSELLFHHPRIAEVLVVGDRGAIAVVVHHAESEEAHLSGRLDLLLEPSYLRLPDPAEMAVFFAL